MSTMDLSFDTAEAPASTSASTSASKRARRVASPTRRLIGTELRLISRDVTAVVFVVSFPVITMLIIGGVFGTEPDEVFPVNPSHWYIAAYLTTVLGAVGLIMLPVHIATYRERGVLRRFAVAGFPRWSFAMAELVIGLFAVAIGVAVLLAVAEPVYGVPELHEPLRVVAAVISGSVLFISIGVLLGTLLPSARAAQAVGLLLFFPSFLLGGGGPPTAAMSDTLANIADVMPLSVVNEAIRDPWLGIGAAGSDDGKLLIIAIAAAVLALVAARRSAL